MPQFELINYSDNFALYEDKRAAVGDDYYSVETIKLVVQKDQVVWNFFVYFHQAKVNRKIMVGKFRHITKRNMQKLSPDTISRSTTKYLNGLDNNGHGATERYMKNTIDKKKSKTFGNYPNT